MKKHLLEECPNQSLECNLCKNSYKRQAFYSESDHNCIKNLLTQIQECRDKIEELKKKRDEDSKNREEIQIKIKNLEKEVSDLAKEQTKIYEER